MTTHLIQGRGTLALRNPADLYAIVPNEEYDFDKPVLMIALTGFVDAGHVTHLATQHLMDTCAPEALARFEVDELIDYRARRPVMTFDADRWSDIELPSLVLYQMQDAAGTPFLFLQGPEPDVQWERFVQAVILLVEHYEVKLTIGIAGIPMGVPHTRPLSVTAHATQPELIREYRPWVGEIQVPGHAAALVEMRLGQAGHEAAGFAVHVPHYVSRSPYPEAAAVVLGACAAMARLDISTVDLLDEGQSTRSAIDDQLEDQPEVANVVRSLERQYDVEKEAREQGLGEATEADLPTGEEIGRELERFLAEENRRQTGE